MGNKPELGKELKALGNELASALKQIRSSREFNELEREVATGLKNISSSLIKGLKAARKSPNTAKIKARLQRVAKAGKARGKIEAVRAQNAAAVGIKKARLAVQQLKKRVNPKG